MYYLLIYLLQCLWIFLRLVVGVFFRKVSQLVISLSDKPWPKGLRKSCLKTDTVYRLSVFPFHILFSFLRVYICSKQLSVNQALSSKNNNKLEYILNYCFSLWFQNFFQRYMVSVLMSIQNSCYFFLGFFAATIHVKMRVQKICFDLSTMCPKVLKFRYILDTSDLLCMHKTSVQHMLT